MSESGVSEDVDTYPSGWNGEPKDDPLTPVIITLSVVLALGICTFIILCVVWRRKRARRLKDPEKRKKRETAVTEEEDAEVRRLQSQQKMWAKASARWKANVKQSARRRRKRQAGAAKDGDARLLTESSHSSSMSLHRMPTGSSSSSAARSTRLSFSDDNTDPPAPTPASPEPDTHRSHRPPAYLSDTSDMAAKARDGFQETVLPLAADSVLGTDNAAASHSSIRIPSSSDDLPLPYPDFIQAGHVATDDKALLARMADLASAPEAPASSITGGSPAVYASVPPLEDDFDVMPFDIHVVDCDAAEAGEPSGSRRTPSPRPPLSPDCTPSYSRDPSPGPSLLPPPPLKGRLAAPTFYEYPASFEEDVLGLEPEMGPSAPPFEDEGISAASAPPLEVEYDMEETDALPSAPPLMDDDVPISGDQESPGSSTESSILEHHLPLQRAASHLTAAPWHTSPPRYLP